MKNFLSAAVITSVILTLSCSSYSVSREVKEGSSIDKIKKAGLVLRISKANRLQRESYQKSISSWIDGYKSLKPLIMLADASDKVISSEANEERFYQETEEPTTITIFKQSTKTYLKYKSLGAVNIYLRENNKELRDLLAKNGLDGFVIYEIYGVVSTEMQFIDFDTVLVITDKNLNVIYMDHQSDNFTTVGTDMNSTKKQLLDKVSERLVSELMSYDFIEKK
jgi:hypothetical protein